jgi:tRNA dimethylallyltransferase
LNPPKEIFLKNIEERAHKMVQEQNIKDEAQLLLNRYNTKLNAFNGGIYKYMTDYLNGDINDSALIEAVIKSDLKLAKKQLTWFKRNNDIKWFEDTNSAWQWLQTQTLDRI